MARVLLGGLVVLLVSSTGMFATSADAFSIFTRRPDSAPQLRLVQDAAPPPSDQSAPSADGQSAGGPSSTSGGGGIGQPDQGSFDAPLVNPSGENVPPRFERPEGNQQSSDNIQRGSEGRPSQFGGGQTGPSDEERQAQDEERQAQEEARQKKMETKQLAQMKRGMKRAAAGLAKMRRQFNIYASKGLTVPSDCSDVLAEAQSVVDVVQNAEDFAAVQEIDMEGLGDSFDTLNECRQNLDRLSRLPQILKRVDKQIRQMERAWTRTKKGAPEGAQDAIVEGDKILADIKVTRVNLEGQIKSGEIEDFESILEDEIFGRFDDIGAAMQQIEVAKNAKSFVAQFKRNLKDAERIITKLKKLGKDTSKLEELLASSKDLYAQINGLKVGSDEWEQAVIDLADLGQDFAEVSGGTEDIGGMIGPPGNGPQLRLEGIDFVAP